MKEKYIEDANKMRKAWATGDGLRDEGLVESDKLVIIKDIDYSENYNDVWHKADIYYPEGTQEKLPVIVSVHGGGWFYGDKELYRFYCMHLAEAGFCVVNFNYRLSPENQYPAGFHDVCSLFDFVAGNADKYPFDLERLFVVGDSAGAQLTSQYSIYATNAEYRKLFSFEDVKNIPVPKKVGLNCGIYDMKDLAERDQSLNLWYLDDEMKANDKESFYNVLDYLTKDFPQAYLMVSVNDPLTVNTAPLKKRLETLGVSHVYKEYGQDNPSDGHVFHVNMKSENGIQCNKDEIAFFMSK